MTDQIGFRVRVRVRIGKPLTSDDLQLATVIEGRDVIIKSHKRDEPLRQAKWIVLTCGSFQSEDEAKAFGERTKRLLTLACFSVRLGVDVGLDKPTSFIDEQFARDAGYIKEHERLAPNVQGVLVIPDDDNTRFPIIEATGTVSADPSLFLRALRESDGSALDFSAAERGIRVMNEALMHPEPLGQMLLAFSAVEELGQVETWSSEQQRLIEDTADAVAQGVVVASITEEERTEVAQAIAKGLFKLSLRQGVIRLLKQNGLDRYKKVWDDLYGQRSGLVHGTKDLPSNEAAELAQKAIDLCGIIILRVLDNHGCKVPEVVDRCWGDWLKRGSAK